MNAICLGDIKADNHFKFINNMEMGNESFNLHPGINLPQDPVPALTDRTILVTVPASVAFDLDKMQTISKNVLGRLGCPGCHSGFDIRYIMERRFRFNENLEFIEGIGR
jgi:hypothetical protein